jgi:hypothetical protein
MAHLETSTHNPSTTNTDVHPNNGNADSRLKRMPRLTCHVGLQKSFTHLLGIHSSIVIDDSEYVEFEIPPAFRKVVLNALTASPTSVDVRNQSPQFYAFSEKIMNLFVPLLSFLM